MTGGKSPAPPGAPRPPAGHQPEDRTVFGLRPARRVQAMTAFLLLMAAVLVITGAAIWSLSLTPFRVFQARVDSLAGDGRADNFTPELFASLVFKFRLFGSLVLLVGAGLAVWRHTVQRAVGRAAGDLRGFVAHAWGVATAAGRSDSRVHRAALLSVFAAGAAIRLRYLMQPMRYDEAATLLEYASRPFYIALSNYSAPNNHLFHTALVRVAYLVFGGSPWAIRLPAFIAGVLLVPAAYLAARMLYNRDAALVAAGLVASSSILIEYSTNARGYTIVALIFILLVALASYLLRSGSRGGWIVFAILGAVGFHTIPIMLYPFGIVCLWLLISALREEVSERRPRLLALTASVAGAAVLVLVFYSPVFTVSGVQAVVGNQYVAPKSWSYFAAGAWSSLGALWGLWTRDLPPGVGVLLAAGLLYASLFHRRLSAYRVAPMLASVAWPVPVVLLQRVIPFERVWLFLLPLCLVTAAAGVHSWIVAAGAATAPRIRARWIAPVALALTAWTCARVIGSQSVLRSTETGTLRDAEAITLSLKGRLRAGDRVVAVVPASYPLAYYFAVHGVPPAHLLADPDTSCRFLVVVDTANQQTLPAVLDTAGVARASLGPVLAVGRYTTATVYEAQPVSAASRTARHAIGSCGATRRPAARSSGPTAPVRTTAGGPLLHTQRVIQ